jgi:hypothetical protein
MTRMTIRPTVALALLVGATACSGERAADADAIADAATSQLAANAASPAVVPPPDLAALPEALRRGLARAFAIADAADRSPTMACTPVVARAAGQPLAADAEPDPDDVRAFELCYVDVGARYVHALLAQIDADISAARRDELCARVASFAIISRASLGGFAQNLRLERDVLDRRLLTAVQGELARACPAQRELFEAHP